MEQASQKSLLVTVLVFISLAIVLFFANEQYGFLNKKTPAEAIYKTCLRKMEDKTCSIMSGPELNILSDKSKSIMIAGFGEMDIELYRGLRQNPLYMCQNILTACQKDSAESLCRFGSLLYKHN